MKARVPELGFVSGIIVGILLVSALISIAIWITVRIPVALNVPPVGYSGVNLLSPASVCPGAVLAFRAQITFDRPALVQTYTSIRDATTGRNVLGTQTAMGVRPQPAPIVLSDTLSFTVPASLPPGDYQHVRATMALNMDAQPAFLVIPFSVRDCEKGANQ
jgi:hypothetical protein